VLAFVVIRTRLLSSLLYNPSGKNGAGARFKGILTVVPGCLMNELFDDKLSMKGGLVHESPIYVFNNPGYVGFWACVDGIVIMGSDYR